MALKSPLIAHRKKNDLSRRELAKAIGVERMTVYRWEKGTRRIDDDVLPKVVEVTGIPAAELRPDLALLMKGAAE